MGGSSRKGSALVAVIWLLAVLSILIASYAIDAHLQTRINIYLRERVTVDHLTDAGLAIAEVILTEYQNVPEAASETDYNEQLEEDRWYAEKLMLKAQGGKEVTTGAVPVDALNPDGGTVTVTIRPIESKFNINNLYAGGDQNFGELWMRILAVSGIPKDYWDGIVNGWCDWRDTDGTTTAGARTEDAGAYFGAFATSFEVTDAKRALEVAAWGRRRWNIEGGFRVEKHGGFGLEHTFCNDDTTGRNYHVLMQIAYALWQVFDTGVLSRLSEGCRKPTQGMWAKLLFLALLFLGLASVPRVAIGAFRMRRYHLAT